MFRKPGHSGRSPDDAPALLHIFRAPRGGSPARAVSDSVVAAPVVSGRYRAGPSDGLVCAPRAGATEVMLLEPREVVAAEPIPR